MISRFVISTVLTIFSTSAFAQDYFYPPMDNSHRQASDLFQIDRYHMQKFLSGSVTFERFADELRYQGAPITQQPAGLFLHRGFNPQEDSVCQVYCYTDSDGNRVCEIICGSGR